MKQYPNDVYLLAFLIVRSKAKANSSGQMDLKPIVTNAWACDATQRN